MTATPHGVAVASLKLIRIERGFSQRVRATAPTCIALIYPSASVSSCCWCCDLPHRLSRRVPRHPRPRPAGLAPHSGYALRLVRPSRARLGGLARLFQHMASTYGSMARGQTNNLSGGGVPAFLAIWDWRSA